MIRYSKYNVFSQIRDSQNYFIVNILSGNADIISKSDAEKLKTLREDKILSEDLFSRELFEKGYFIDDQEEKKLYTSKYLDFIDARERDEVQLFFIINYSCTFLHI